MANSYSSECLLMIDYVLICLLYRYGNIHFDLRDLPYLNWNNGQNMCKSRKRGSIDPEMAYIEE